MATEEIIIRLFCIVDDRIGPVKKRSDAHLHDSAIVTIGLLFSLKGGRYRTFYRWLNANYRSLFPRLPDITRLLRLLQSRAYYADEFLDDPNTGRNLHLVKAVNCALIENLHDFRCELAMKIV